MLLAASPAPESPALSAPTTTATRDYAGLSNVLLISKGLINGSAPHGDAGLDTIRDLGVKTIICVDASPPNAAGATARGMRYVHLPIGYDGITQDESLRLMRAAADLPKPIYIHCFHGRHRSPAAASVIAIGLGWLTVDEAMRHLSTAGTSAKYAGLFATISRTRRVSH